ncbi:helix-turn-helix domain-containing protein [Streptomyces sp. M10(2022)]
MTGSSMVVQNGRECLLRPGDCAVFESIAPYALLFDKGVDYRFIRFPARHSRSPTGYYETSPRSPEIRQPHCTPRLPLLLPTGRQRRVARGGHADAVVEPSIELLRAVLTSQYDNPSLAKAPLEATLSLRVTHYIRKYLADSDLSAARIAAAHDISVRHLYVVLSRSGISLGDWIRARRLAECRRELADPNGRLRTIAATGRRWGFVDATHFSKVFKQAYGISPRAWRDQNHPALALPRRPRW